MPKLIRDEFSGNPDRRRRYMLRKLAEGKCRLCGKPAAPGSTFCAYHVEKRKGYAKAARAKTEAKQYDELV